MENLFKRKGTFKISRPLILQEPKAVLEILKDILIVKCDNDFMADSIIYYGYSKHFDITEENEEPPTYYAENTNQNGKVIVKWYKKKDIEEMLVEQISKQLLNK